VLVDHEFSPGEIHCLAHIGQSCGQLHSWPREVACWSGITGHGKWTNGFRNLKCFISSSTKEASWTKVSTSIW